MTIRSIVVVGILVVGSGAFVLGQGTRVPGVVVDAVRQLQPPGLVLAKRTTLATPPMAGHIPSWAEVYVCRLANVGETKLSALSIKIFDRHGQELSTSGDCGSSLEAGHVCQNETLLGLPIPVGHDDDPDGPTGHVAYCKISFVGDSDSARGALQGTTLLDALDGVYAPGPVIEAR